ncbi:hypothetical protein GYMLUDRAFT_50239 [Collybiopsis luxurians FD-317 M1]|uniref:Uncharacterized protein n=1 Tax=Collybiopsis luxurians FD-317 M1 TaxID=944289 RepID=A0A0D0CAS3_9AGAR|nr:hypothetical protein GYMLUDRAFT_50239 [Collybiopsis luxurians FD-317 M1]
MPLLARFSAFCFILAGLLAVAASPLAIIEHDRRGPASEFLIFNKKYHNNQEGPSVWLTVRQGFALLPNPGGQPRYTVYDTTGPLQNRHKKPELVTTLGNLRFPQDGGKSKDAIVQEIKALQPNSMEDFITRILGIVQKYIYGDVLPKEEWLKAIKEPGQATSEASGSQGGPKKSDIHNVLHPQQPAAGASGSQGAASNPPNVQQGPKKSNIHDVLSPEPKKSDIHKVMNRAL